MLRIRWAISPQSPFSTVVSKPTARSTVPTPATVIWPPRRWVGSSSATRAPRRAAATAAATPERPPPTTRTSTSYVDGCGRDTQPSGCQPGTWIPTVAPSSVPIRRSTTNNVFNANGEVVVQNPYPRPTAATRRGVSGAVGTKTNNPGDDDVAGVVGASGQTLRSTAV